MKLGQEINQIRADRILERPPGRIRGLRRPWRIRGLGRPWRIRGLGRPWRIRGLGRPWPYFFRWPRRVRELRGLGPRPGHPGRGYMAPPKKHFLGKFLSGSRSGGENSGGRSGVAGSGGRSGGAGSGGRSGRAGSGGRSGGAGT